MNIDNFFKDTKQRATSNGIKIYYGKGKRVRLPTVGRSNGFYDKSTLAVATGKPFNEWMPILLHESSHMDQHLDNSPLWDNNLDESYLRLEEFLNGNHISTIKEDINAVLRLEADCERRSFNKIIEYNLPINSAEYAQKANSYLYFHAWMYKNASWYSTAPYEIEEIWKNMPDTIYDIEHYTIDNISNINIDIFNLCKQQN